MTTVNKSDLIQAALIHRNWGWSVIPTAGKRPATYWKQYQTRRPHDREICGLLDRQRVDGFAVIFGRISGGLAACDFDTEDGYLKWAKSHDPLANALPTMKTARGFQVFCRMPAEQFFKFPKGEFRANSGHYSMLPPSRHPSGIIYRWCNNTPTGPSSFPLLTLQEIGLIRTSNEKAIVSTNKKEGKGQPSQEETQYSCETLTSRIEVFSMGIDRCIEEAVYRSMPNGPGERSERLFLLACHLKGIPEIADNGPERLKEIVGRWHTLAQDVIQTKDWEQSWKQFQGDWRNAKPIGNGGRVEEAVFLATLGLSEPDDRLIASCRVLQDIHGDDPFFLSSRSAARWAGYKNQRTACRRLARFCELGILREVQKGIKSARIRRASMWQYLGA